MNAHNCEGLLPQLEDGKVIVVLNTFFWSHSVLTVVSVLVTACARQGKLVNVDREVFFQILTSCRLYEQSEEAIVQAVYMLEGMNLVEVHPDGYLIVKEDLIVLALDSTDFYRVI